VHLLTIATARGSQWKCVSQIWGLGVPLRNTAASPTVATAASLRCNLSLLGSKRPLVDQFASVSSRRHPLSALNVTGRLGISVFK